MSQENFDASMKQYSSKAEGEQLEMSRRRARAARRQKMKIVVRFLAVGTLVAFGYYKQDEIRDTVARLTPVAQSEYQRIVKLARDTNAQKSDGSAPSAIINVPIAQLKTTLQSAKTHNEVTENAMNDSLDAKKP